jgi:excisionase family DNA binding protein
MGDKALWTIEDVAVNTGLSKAHVYRLTSTRRIPHCKVGKRVLFVPEAVVEWVKSQAVVNDRLAS